MEGHGECPNPPAALPLASVPGAALPLASVPGAAATVAGAATTFPGGRRDRLSRLPNDLLVHILLNLGTKEAVRTSALSRQWRRIWIQLPVLNFEGVDSSVPADALAVYNAHSEVDINNLTVSSNQMDAQPTTTWLSLAAPLLSGWLHFNNSHTLSRETLRLFLNDPEEAVVRRHAFQLPCFNRATDMLMDLGFLGLVLPPTGVFDALRVIWLQHFWFRGQLSMNDTVFPSLQELTIRTVRGLVMLKLNSNSMLHIHLSVLPELQNLDISAPGLKKLEVTHCFYNVPAPVATIVAGRLEVLRWEVPCVPQFREKPHPRVLRVPAICTHWDEDICANFLNYFPSVYHLGLQISLQVQGVCSPGCICRNEPVILGSEVAPIRALQQVEVVNFHGSPREVHFLKQLVLRAPKLKLLRITSKVEEPSLDSIKEILPANCWFEINLDRRDNQFIYPDVNAVGAAAAVEEQVL